MYMNKKSSEGQVEDFIEEAEDIGRADLIITLVKDLRVLVFRTKKEYLLQEFRTRVSRGKGKKNVRPVGARYGEWSTKGSFGNIEQALVLAARCGAEMKLSNKIEVTIKEYIDALKSSNAEFSTILKEALQ